MGLRLAYSHLLMSLENKSHVVELASEKNLGLVHCLATETVHFCVDKIEFRETFLHSVQYREANK